MANPKKQTSTRKRNSRRSHHALVAPNLVRCSNCQELKLLHRICPGCGHYKGKRIIATEQA